MPDSFIGVLIERDHPSLRDPDLARLVRDAPIEAGAREALVLLVLPHPLEDHTLAATKRTADQYQREGRWLLGQLVACRGCGHAFDRIWLKPQRGLNGCLVVLIVSLITGAVVGIAFGSILAGLGLGWCVVLLYLWVYEKVLERRTRRRFPERLRALAHVHRCPRCGSGDVQPPQAVSWRRLACPNCGERAYQYRTIGIS